MRMVRPFGSIRARGEDRRRGELAHGGNCSLVPVNLMGDRQTLVSCGLTVEMLMD
jgi:hypothetical protein